MCFRVDVVCVRLREALREDARVSPLDNRAYAVEEQAVDAHKARLQNLRT